MVEEAAESELKGAAGVVALVLVEWTAGLIAAGAWTQSWSVVKRGHFRIVAWIALALGVLGWIANRSALDGNGGIQPALVAATVVGALLYVAVQYSRTDLPGVVVGWATALVGAGALVASSGLLTGWNDLLAGAGLVVGAVLIGAVTNGMLLGHWYLNQPGLKPWALARLTLLSLGACAAAAATGLAATPKLASASTEGAALGIPGFGESFGPVFFIVWLGLVVFTGVVVWMARRCIAIRSIQSATGLYYVALLTAGVAEFLVRYLMVNA